ncbi:hypothetical protein PUNSTDRAFT_79718 [Punctularia strigosozonata HHB-11173 SS5]|uniref:uncharacterized protein n=1 Tax=Punctularia strigosozonata (strain HHB-11173) TaxID=741275 RepID=UPI0004416B77|nr:uncharacterized protein PUNSTDRAFT_79718 [Punctularia strigosozonata HHB-11173 SS5]EIN13855.1 hypothetical protein PUNSTDRAFT_79718 [Punctularia strigosozonata HHB-11173 SS5]
MMSSLPPFPTLSNSPTPRALSPPGTPTIDPAGPPPPPPLPPMPDNRLAAMLSSPAIMNGSFAKGRESVWALLDRLRAPHRSAGAQDDAREKVAEPASTLAELPVVQEEEEDDDDNSSVMFYAPLSPTPESELELAPVETVEVDERGRIVEVISTHDHKHDSDGATGNQLPGEPQEAQKSRFWDGWPLPRRKPPGETANGKLREVNIWVPSTNKISLEARWWGFRIYLPPPVLEVLSNKQLEAGKRAAMLTTALQWMVSRIPVNLVPVQFRPAAMILKRLIPYLGYLGGFIAWSWGGIKAFDKGHGVILSATWLMPIALIPGSWEADEIPHLSDPAASRPEVPRTPAPASATDRPLPPTPSLQHATLSRFGSIFGKKKG